MNRIFFYLYGLIIYLYTAGIRIYGLINPKAALWIRGRKRIFQKIEEALEKEQGKKIAWFHCASLGEFEQGRPVMEAFRKSHPEYRIFLTFFSPSGFEVRKNYSGADHIFYLPADTGKNASRFIHAVKPRIAFFIKYEYWFNYIRELEKQDIPVYIVSAIFRKDQQFFRWYGKWAFSQLKKIKWFFLQDEASLHLLKGKGISNVTVTGDTRFDRVLAVSSEKRDYPAIEKFCSGKKVFLVGSSWPEDERVYLPFVQSHPGNWKFIIAPHETNTNRIASLEKSLNVPAIKYSEIETTTGNADVLIINGIGMLAHLYRYATVAYVGGGFGTGLHNILEAAVFGIPVIIGPEYGKFNEARDLVKMGGVLPISTAKEFSEVLQKLDSDPEFMKHTGGICQKYVMERGGATRKILEMIHA